MYFRSSGARKLLLREVSYEIQWLNQFRTQKYFRTIESVWVPKNSAQIF